MDTEIINSWKETLNKRASSSLYGTLVLYWLIFHWNFVFTLLFVSEEKIWNVTGLLKNDYLVDRFFDYSGLSFYILWVFPFLLTWLTIWIFPRYIIIPSFRREEEDESEKLMIKISERRKIASMEAELEKVNSQKINTEAANIKKEEEIKEAITTTWARELRSLKNHSLFPRFREIIDTVYANGGRTHRVVNKQWMRYLSADVMAFADTRGLIKITRGSSDIEEKIELTDKGKFFAENLY